MEKIARIILVIALSLLLISCEPKLLKPGDKIGDMELLSYCEGTNIIDICTYDDLQDGSCVVPASWKTFWVSAGYAMKTTEELEISWKDSTWKLTFDGKPVDLTAFGTYDLEIEDPQEGTMKARVWNFCISNPLPGRHTARYDFTFVNGERVGNHNLRWEFTVLEP